MNKQELAKQYLSALVIPLTRKPEMVVINTHVDDNGRGIIMNVLADDIDLPLLIGGGGLMARTIRRMMLAWCELNSARVIVHIGNPLQYKEHD
jgi:predicted RNA-binding protein YlqC (UPF0109 family)